MNMFNSGSLADALKLNVVLFLYTVKTLQNGENSIIK